MRVRLAVPFLQYLGVYSSFDVPWKDSLGSIFYGLSFFVCRAPQSTPWPPTWKAKLSMIELMIAPMIAPDA